MPSRDVVVVAASAGGIEALKDLLSGVPVDYDGVILVVVHIPTVRSSALARILDRAGPLAAAEAVDGEPLEKGRVYVCVADRHLLLHDGHVLVRRGPRENGYRPAADPLFRSAARYFGPRAVGVVLSGNLGDGTSGLGTIRRQGGVAVVQDPDDALFDGMPVSALDHVGADYVLPAHEIGPLLADLASDSAPAEGPVAADVLQREVALMEGDADAIEDEHAGQPSPWPCPDCNGVLWQIEEGEVLRFRCRVGHAWSAEDLLHEQHVEVEAALWIALRSLEDREALSRRLLERAQRAGRTFSAGRLRSDLADMARSIEVLRRLVHSDDFDGVFEEPMND
jgi:two-component system chemotaxis response regulator CheB